MVGGGLKEGKILGHYPSTLGPDGEVDEEALLALTTARMLNPLLLSAEVVPVQAVAYDAINA